LKKFICVFGLVPYLKLSMSVDCYIGLLEY
jgi:hypothetical protein